MPNKGEADMITDRITRPEDRMLAEEEFIRFAELVASLRPDEWRTPTDCTGLGCPQDGAARARLR